MADCQQLVPRHSIIHNEKKEDLQLTPSTEINAKRIKDLNVKSKALKTLAETAEESLQTFSGKGRFLNCRKA